MYVQTITNRSRAESSSVVPPGERERDKSAKKTRQKSSHVKRDNTPVDASLIASLSQNTRHSAPLPADSVPQHYSRNISLS